MYPALPLSHVVKPRGCYKYAANITKITFKGQDLPDRVYIGGAFCKVKPYIPPLNQCVNCWKFGHPAKYCRYATCCPLCASPDHTCTNCSSTKCICANCTQEHNVFFRDCIVYKFESKVAALCFKHGLTLKEARKEVCSNKFLSAHTQHPSDHILHYLSLYYIPSSFLHS